MKKGMKGERNEGMGELINRGIMGILCHLLFD